MKTYIVTYGQGKMLYNSLVQCGETVVLVNACASKEPREGVDFFPLSCDFEEKLLANGKEVQTAKLNEANSWKHTFNCYFFYCISYFFSVFIIYR